MSAHPHRLAPTLAQLGAHDDTIAAPGPGSADCRIDLKLLQWRALEAARTSPKARTRLAAFDGATHAQLWAGTVQDGVARGFAAALEEAASLAPVAPAGDPFAGAEGLVDLQGRDLVRKKDILVASSGARVRFGRKDGLLFVQREGGLHSANFLRFEDRADHGTLDAPRFDEGERPRIFSAQFLKPVRYRTCKAADELVLEGGLGRGNKGHRCRIVVRGIRGEQQLRLTIAVDNRHADHRLRVRFLGIPPTVIAHHCTDVAEVVQNDAGGFVAFTLVRATGTLDTAHGRVATPAAQCLGWLEHEFLLG